MTGRGRFISFEGSEGCGKSTQIRLLAERLRQCGLVVRTLREPGGTSIGEEIRHTLQHSSQNHLMTAEAELLLMNASRAQLVREIIRPALAAGEFVLCDRFLDSTHAYQGYGRQLPLDLVQTITQFAVGETLPDLTFLLIVSPQEGARRIQLRQAKATPQRDRIEEADAAFFERVQRGFQQLATQHSMRIKTVDGSPSPEKVSLDIWNHIQPFLPVL